MPEIVLFRSISGFLESARVRETGGFETEII